MNSSGSISDAIVQLKEKFEKIDSSLESVKERLETGFLNKNNLSPEEALFSPVVLIQRLKLLQQKLPHLYTSSLSIIYAKHELIRECQSTLVENRRKIQHLQLAARMEVEQDSDDVTYQDFVQSTRNWQDQTAQTIQQL